MPLFFSIKNHRLLEEAKSRNSLLCLFKTFGQPVRYHFPEFSFELPPGATDQSVVVLSVPVTGALPLTIVIMRHSHVGLQSLAEFVVGDIMTRESNGEDYALLWKKTYHHDGVPGFILAGTLANGATSERRLYLAMSTIIVTVTAQTHGDFASAQLASLNAFVGTLRVAALSRDASFNDPSSTAEKE